MKKYLLSVISIFITVLAFPDDYYDDWGTYLGNDGQGDQIRLIKSPVSGRTKDKIKGLYTSNRERAYLKSPKVSAIITIRPFVQYLLQKTGDQSLISGKEHVMVVLMDIYSDQPYITATSAPPGDNTRSERTVIVDSGRIFHPTNAFLVLAQVHGHPPTEKTNYYNIPNVSDIDVLTAQYLNVPIYAIDAFGVKPGEPMNIHRANPRAKGLNNKTAYIGKTGGSFNIALDALEIHGGKRDY
ncbi:MAG TPA: hypothetical protein ACFCUD_12445 [Cyclobacteriaceae bacterium]